ncbi:hypothetical protein KM1_318840 [Entamoeba histolytica HM-3:IMSS]|uniref:Uncharacterized protein n=1 Tax=Entamoeba histolytica HM-3:IMSS TaxID=885315 RepID=M7X4A6_ENTHI|nr:hypothetical protein KM1_318840 [Entamoeba histolytica HM-3:IMSS]
MCDSPEERSMQQRLSKVKISDLIDYFRGIDDLKYLCSDFLDCFDKEQKNPCNLPKYDLLMEKEAELVKEIHDTAKEMIENYAEIILSYEERAAERERKEQIEIIKRLEKKPKLPKVD